MRFGDFPIKHGADGSWSSHTKVVKGFVIGQIDGQVPELLQNHLWIYGKSKPFESGPVAVVGFPLNTALVVREEPA
jgi:hypothetical protein